MRSNNHATCNSGTDVSLDNNFLWASNLDYYGAATKAWLPSCVPRAIMPCGSAGRVQSPTHAGRRSGPAGTSSAKPAGSRLAHVHVDVSVCGHRPRRALNVGAAPRVRWGRICTCHPRTQTNLRRVQAPGSSPCGRAPARARRWMLCCSGTTLSAPSNCPCGPGLAAGSWRARKLCGSGAQRSVEKKNRYSLLPS